MSSQSRVWVAPPDTTEPLEAVAARFAEIPSDEAEQVLDGYIAAAIGQWRVSDATFWQRIKYRSRLIRAVARRAGAG